MPNLSIKRDCAYRAAPYVIRYPALRNVRLTLHSPKAE